MCFFFYNTELENMMTIEETFKMQALVLNYIHVMEDHEQIF